MDFDLAGELLYEEIVDKMSKTTRWQAWIDDECVTFADIERIDELRMGGQISASAILLHEIYARTGEEAMSMHHKKMGWEAYQPDGKSVPCPNNCGGSYLSIWLR